MILKIEIKLKIRKMDLVELPNFLTQPQVFCLKSGLHIIKKKQ